MCTNVLARGFDIPEVDFVLNYDIPLKSDRGFMEPDYENYLHRVGRTGRFGTVGLSLTMYNKFRDGVDTLDEGYKM